jgi:hypothetical protein
MRSQYLLTYEPTNQNRDGSYRKIEVQLANPQLQKDKVKVTHRQGYFCQERSEEITIQFELATPDRISKKTLPHFSTRLF